MGKQEQQLTTRHTEGKNNTQASAEDILAGLEAKVGVSPETRTSAVSGVKMSAVPETKNGAVPDAQAGTDALNSAAPEQQKAASEEQEQTGQAVSETEAPANAETVSDVSEPEAAGDDVLSFFDRDRTAHESEINGVHEVHEITFSDNTEDLLEEEERKPGKFKLSERLAELKKIPVFEKIKEKLKPKVKDKAQDTSLAEENETEETPLFEINEIFQPEGEDKAQDTSSAHEDEAGVDLKNMSFWERFNYKNRMRRREQTRLRRENARRNGNGLDLPYQPMTIIDIRFTLIRLAVACVFLALGTLLKKNFVGLVFSFIAYLIAMLPIAIKVVQNFTHGTYFDENLLILTASFGAFLLGSRVEASVVLILHAIGKMANDLVLASTHKSLAKPISFLPEVSSVVNMQGDERKVAPSEIKPGEFILVRGGERIPIDSVVLRGEGTVDDSALTGNAEPMQVVQGAKVLAGGLYEGSLILLRSVAKLDDCAVSRVLRIQEKAPEQKAGLETGIVEGAERFIPIIVLLAVLLAVIPPLFHSDTSLSNWVYRALTIVLVCCPSILTIAVPLSFTSGIGHLAQRGIHAKGSAAIEKMAELRMMVFDKTGTLTEGKLKIKDIQPAHEFTSESCLALAAAAEQKSQHLIAKAIVAACPGVSQKITEFEEYPGRGVRARIGNSNLLVGNRKLMVSRGVKGVPDIRDTVIYVAYEGDYAGAIVLEDKVRPEAAKAIEGLKSQGVLRTVLLSGDTETPAQQIAEAIGIDTVHSGLLPEEKASKMEFLLRTIPTDGTSGYVGNGIDDLDELRQADVGIVMGIAGSQKTADTADMLIMTNDLSRVTEAVRVCRKSHSIALQNMALALITKIILAIMGLVGVVSMWQAVSADVLITVLTVLNAARIIGGK